MSQTTAARYATSGATTGGGKAWANPGNVTADDGTKSAVTVSTVSGGLSSQNLHGSNYSVLEEEGGPIPAGATIIRVTGTVEFDISVTDSITANVATVTATLGRTGGTSHTLTRTQNDNTSATDVTLAPTTGGTEAVPQTTFARADLDNDSANEVFMTLAVSLPTGALNSATCSCDYMRIAVEWILYAAEWGCTTEDEVLARGTTIVTAQQFALSVQGEDQRGDRTIVLPDLGAVLVQGNDTFAPPQLLVERTGILEEDEQLFRSKTEAIARAFGTVVEGHVATGDAKAYQYTFQGTTCDETGAPLGSCTVWLFTTADRLPVATTTSHATTGVYSFSLTSDPRNYFARAHHDGPPERTFGTTDRNLQVDEVQVYP